MVEVHYGVVQIDGQWMVITDGLRAGPYDSLEHAERVVRRMADQAAGLEVQLHLQDETGELHQESLPATDGCSAAGGPQTRRDVWPQFNEHTFAQ